MVFYVVSTVIHLYHGGQCTYPCFHGVLLSSTQHNILSKPLAAFHITIVEITDSGERGMNPVAMTIIHPRKEYWPSRGSNQRSLVLKLATLPTELWGSALGNRIENASSQKLLGIHIASTLSWKNYIVKICAKLFTKLHLMKPINCFLTLKNSSNLLYFIYNPIFRL